MSIFNLGVRRMIDARKLCALLATGCVVFSPFAASAEGGRMGIEYAIGPTVNDRGTLVVAQRLPTSNFTAIAQNDIIIKVNGMFFRDADEFSSYIYQHNPGDMIEITFLRASEHYAGYTQQFRLIGDAGSPQTATGDDSSDTTWTDVALAGLAALAAIIILGGSGDSSPDTSGGGGSSGGNNYPDSASRSSSDQGGYSSRADTSVGCAWGDRAYGTCH